MEYILILILLIWSTLHFDGKGWNSNRWYWCLCGLLSVFMGFRYNVGGDSMVYSENFRYIPTFSTLTLSDLLDTKYAPLWVLYESFCKSIINDFTFVQITQSTFVNIVFFSFFKKHTTFKYTAVLFYSYLYFLYYNTEILRAAISTSLFLMSYGYFKENKYIKYYIYVAISILFHYQAIILIILPLAKFLKLIPINKSSLLFLLGIAFFVQFSFDFIPVLQSAFEDFQQTLYLIDLYSEGKSIHNSNMNGVIAHAIFQLPLLFILYYNKGHEDRDLYCVFLLYVIFSSMSLSLSTLVDRSRDLFGPILIVTMAHTVERLKYSRAFAYKYLGIFAILSILFLKIDYYTNNGKYRLWYPYSSIIDKDDIRIKQYNNYLNSVNERK